MVDKKADIIAVAKAAGVSASTVSRSFNHPELVKKSTRRKIERAVRRLGYIRNRAAQTIHGIRSGTIGLIVPTVDQAIFAELIQSFTEAVEVHGFTILLASHGYSLDREYALARKMLEHRVDGVALIGTEHTQDTFELLTQQSIPAVLLWNYAKASLFPCVGSDNFEAGALIAQHVVDLGHTKIASVFPPLEGNDRAEHRFAGVLHALQQAGQDIPDYWRKQTPYRIAAAKEIVTALMYDPERPTAIICGNDVLAWGALHALVKTGSTVPADVTVTGIGDFRGSMDFEPALTTVRIPARTIGLRGADVIAEQIKTQNPDLESQLIRPQLICRSTSSRPSGV